MKRLFQSLFGDKKYQKGQLLVELLFAVGIASVFLPALLTGLVSSREGKAQQQQRLQAVTILKQAQDATRSVREKGWAIFAVNGTYNPIVSGSSWSLASGSATTNGFTTQVVISDVYRDSAGAIVTSGGTLDPSTKKVVTTVSWVLPYPSSTESTEYLTRFLDNDAYIETTQTQFNAGTKTGVTVRSTTGSSVPDDGEITLGAGGNSDWCTPTLTAATINLPGSGYPSSVTAIEGKAFIGTGENASGLSFVGININNTRPPTATQGSTFDGHKTNGVFGETNYGYITTDTNAQEVVIINISGSTYSEIGYFNAPGNGSGKGIHVVGSTGYMTAGNKLYNFDLSSKSGSRPIRDPDGVTLAGNANKVIVVGNYAFVAVAASPELQIVDISNPINMVVVGSRDLNSQAAKGLFVSSDGNRAYVATAHSATQDEFFILNTENKTNPTLVSGSSRNTSPMDPKAVTVVPGNRAIIVGQNGQEYQVFNIANENSVTSCGGTDVNDGINDVASILESDGDAYSYITTSEADYEFRIIEGGPGGSYATSGIFESATFNPGYSTANNRLTAVFNEPSGTDIRFQVSLANLVGGACPVTGGYTFVGPDPLNPTGSYFNQASGEPITFPFITTGTYTNPGQCFRYKAYFTTTNINNTPVLQEVIINYSP